MNQKQYRLIDLTVGGIVGALICGGIVIALAHQPAPATQIAATSTSAIFQAPPHQMLAELTSSTIAISVPLNITTSTPDCLVEQKSVCVLATKDFIVDLQLLKAIRSGNFSISGNNISIPIGNGSSSDLLSVLNYMQSEIGK